MFSISLSGCRVYDVISSTVFPIIQNIKYNTTLQMNATAHSPVSAATSFLGNTLRLCFYAVSHGEMLLALPPWMNTTQQQQRSTVTIADLKLANLPDYTMAAIPAFIFLCALELCVGLCRGKWTYRINDGLVSFMSGAVMLIVRCLLSPTIGLSSYCWIWSHYGFQGLIPLDSWVHYVGLLLAADCGYYWFHRSAHEYHFSWAAHSVHHSGEDYNFATALRQGALQFASSWPFYLLPALVFHPALFVMHRALNTLGRE